MSDKFFIDTNVFICCFDDSQSDKKVRALSIIADALQTGNGMISWQVLQEFLNVSIRKFMIPLKPEDAKVYLTWIYTAQPWTFLKRPGILFMMRSSLQEHCAVGVIFYTLRI